MTRTKKRTKKIELKVKENVTNIFLVVTAPHKTCATHNFKTIDVIHNLKLSSKQLAIRTLDFIFDIFHISLDHFVMFLCFSTKCLF